MKRIICLIDTFKIGGGAQTQLAGLAVMLKNKGYDVTTISYHKVTAELSLDPYLTENGVRHICLDGANNMWQKIREVRKVIKQTSPDTIVAYLDGPATICAILKLFGGKFKLIVSERNVTQRLTVKEYIKFILYRFADWIVPNAFSQENFIKERFPFLAEKVYTISNFVDTNKFWYNPSLKSNTNQKLEILVVARVNPQKNIMRFLEAISILKKSGMNLHVSWYGRKDANYYQQCINRMLQLNVSDLISFLEPTKDINMVYMDEQYDVFCLPSLFEGCPNTIGEAMSSGLPILCGNICDNARYVENGVNGFCFNPYDCTDIADAILKFANTNNEKRMEMRAQSRKRAISLLSQDSFIKKYTNII